MTNDVLAEFVCHNVFDCVLGMFSMGLAVEFGGNNDEVDDIAGGNNPRIFNFRLRNTGCTIVWAIVFLHEFPRPSK